MKESYTPQKAFTAAEGFRQMVPGSTPDHLLTHVIEGQLLAGMEEQEIEEWVKSVLQSRLSTKR